jgi:hypothetical protein
MEAAADILASSKGKAGAMPMEKLPGSEYTELGGPTNKPAEGEDRVGEDPYKDYQIKDNGAKQTEAPKTKPSSASTVNVNKMQASDGKTTLTPTSRIEKESVEEDGEVIAEMHGDEAEDKAMMKKMKMKEKMKEDVDALFADDSTISEEFKSKVSTIFEARVEDRVTQIEEEIETRYAGMLEEAVESVKADLTEKVDDYLSYVVEQWMEENEIAIESGLRAELTEDFIGGLRNLFAEHYIDVPAEKVDLVDELAGKVEELESKLNEEIERGVSYAKALVESRKNEIAREVTEGLTATQAEKIKSLAESVEFSTEDEYKNKLDTIRENYFPSGAKKATEAQLNEQFEEEDDKKVLINDPFVAAVSQAISKKSKF